MKTVILFALLTVVNSAMAGDVYQGTDNEGNKCTLKIDDYSEVKNEKYYTLTTHQSTTIASAEVKNDQVKFKTNKSEPGSNVLSIYKLRSKILFDEAGKPYNFTVVGKIKHKHYLWMLQQGHGFIDAVKNEYRITKARLGFAEEVTHEKININCDLL